MTMTEEAPPRLFEHCLRVFERMKSEAEATKIEGQHALVYEGFLTHLFQDLELATPYYTSVMQRLRKMRCVRQLSRGGGNSPSRWELIKDPDWDTFEGSEQRRLRTDTKLGQVQQQVTEMNRRLLIVEEQLKNMQEAV